MRSARRTSSIFDGQSLVLDENGDVVARGPAFEEALLVVDVDASTAVGRRLRDARRRSLARALNELPDPPEVDVPVGDAAGRPPATPVVAPLLDDLEEMRLAIELGLRDYVEKNDFTDVVLGISGGIDSALTAALAVEALGPEHVVCVSMPSQFSSAETRADARARRRVAGRPLPRDSHRLRRRGRRAQRSPRPSPARSAAWPRRTSRRACAG